MLSAACPVKTANHYSFKTDDSLLEGKLPRTDFVAKQFYRKSIWAQTGHIQALLKKKKEL